MSYVRTKQVLHKTKTSEMYISRSKNATEEFHVSERSAVYNTP